MKKPSAFSHQRSANRRLFQVLTIIAFAVMMLGASDDARFNTLGHKMMCTCGCNQILLECNHVGCTVSDTMRNEIVAGLTRGDNDDLLLQGFVQKYGATVLAAPTTKGFNRIAWIMPFAVLGLGTWIAVMFVRRWQSHPVTVVSADGLSRPGLDVDSLRRQAREETEL